MADRLLEVADIVVAAVDAAWDPAEPDKCSREYGVEGDLTTVKGRRLYAFPVGDGEAERLDRTTVVWEYRFVLIAFERYEPAGLPPKEWMDDRLNWYRTTVYDALNVDRASEYLGGTLYTQAITRDLAYDFDAYRDGVFWCEGSLALREKIAG